MISWMRKDFYGVDTEGHERYYIEAFGLSTDTKPTTGIVTGSVFVEVDTAKAFLFDEENGEWDEVGGAGNG